MSVLRRTPRNCVFSFRTVASVVVVDTPDAAPQALAGGECEGQDPHQVDLRTVAA